MHNDGDNIRNPDNDTCKNDSNNNSCGSYDNENNKNNYVEFGNNEDAA